MSFALRGYSLTWNPLLTRTNIRWRCTCLILGWSFKSRISSRTVWAQISDQFAEEMISSLFRSSSDIPMLRQVQSSVKLLPNTGKMMRLSLWSPVISATGKSFIISKPQETMADDTSGEADSHALHTTQTSLLWSIPCLLSNRLLHLLQAFSPNLLSLSKSFLPLPPIRTCLSGNPSSTWIMKVWIFCASLAKMVLLRSGMDTWRGPRSVCPSSIVVQHLTDIRILEYHLWTKSYYRTP